MKALESTRIPCSILTPVQETLPLDFPSSWGRYMTLKVPHVRFMWARDALSLGGELYALWIANEVNTLIPQPPYHPDSAVLSVFMITLVCYCYLITLVGAFRTAS